MAGRTLLQQAAPITFGLKAAGWLLGLDGCALRSGRSAADRALAPVRRSGGHAGGARGRRSRGGGGDGRAARADDADGAVAQQPRARGAGSRARWPWPAARWGRSRTDVALLAQTEVGELREGGERGGSSTLPQKRNPVRAMAVIACADRAPGLGASRARGDVPGARAWRRRMAGRVGLSGRAPAPHRLGRRGAQRHARRARDRYRAHAREHRSALDEREPRRRARHARWGRPPPGRSWPRRPGARTATACRFRDALLESPEIASALGAEGLDAALDPARYLGATQTLIDRALGARSTTDGEGGTMTDWDEGLRIRREVLGDAHVEQAAAPAPVSSASPSRSSSPATRGGACGRARGSIAVPGARSR